MPFFVRDDEFEHTLIPFLMESVRQGVSVIDKDLNMVFINRAAMKMLGLPYSVIKEDCSLEHLYRFKAERGDFGPGDTEEHVAEFMDLTKKSIAHDFEREQLNGRIIQIQGTPIGEIGFVTLYTDVTEQRAYEANLEAVQYELELKLENSLRELRESRDLMANAIDAIDDGLIVFDEDDRLVLANQRMLKLYPSLKRHLIQNAHISKIKGFELPGQDETGEHAADERYRVERKLHDDKWYRIELSTTATNGKIAVYSNISTYKEQTSKLQDHTNQLFKLLKKEINLSETQREFVSMASHEFKTPLAIIDSNAQRIQRKAGSIEEEALLTRTSNIRESVERLQYLINRFMDFSSEEITGFNMDAKKQKFRLDLEKLCLSHMEMEEGTRIEWDLDALPEYANFDQTIIDQCVSNVLANAIKYSESGSLVRVVGKRNERYLMIEVHDQGVGIPETELSKIFNKYYRASTSSGIAGTGIGLNFAQMALKEHGGHIEATSTVGEGSCFTIFLPASIAIDDTPAEASPTGDTEPETSSDDACDESEKLTNMPDMATDDKDQMIS